MSKLELTRSVRGLIFKLTINLILSTTTQIDQKNLNTLIKQCDIHTKLKNFLNTLTKHMQISVMIS